MGPDDGNVNTTQDCEYDIANDIPCFEPLVWTTGPNRFNGPDPEELEQACANGGVRLFFNLNSALGVTDNQS